MFNHKYTSGFFTPTASPATAFLFLVFLFLVFLLFSFLLFSSAGAHADEPALPPAPTKNFPYLLYFGIALTTLAAAGLIWLYRMRHIALRQKVLHQSEQLRESEDRFRILFEESRQALMLIEDGVFIAANKAALNMLGMQDPKQIMGRSPIEISPQFQPDGMASAQKAEALINIAIAQGSHDFEWIHLRANNEFFVAHVQLTAIQQNNKILLHTHYADITEQKQTERELERYRQHLETLVAERTSALADITQSLITTTDALRKNNEKQQAIFDTASSGIAHINNRIILQCNRRMEELFGYAPGEMINQPTRNWYQSETTFSRIGHDTLQQMSQSGVFRAEQLLVRRDGSTFWGRMTAKPLNKHNPSLGFVGTIEDISNEHAAVEIIKKAQLMAEEAANTKTSFLANMSHEIRTPLNAIIGMTYLALKTDNAVRKQDFLGKIETSSQHLLGIINDILDFSKIEAGKLDIEQVDFKLKAVFDHVTDLIAERCLAKGLKFYLSIDEQVPRNLIGDPLRIGQVLINFANNAVKFTAQGEVALCVKVVQIQANEVILHFSVRDTGIGIDEEQRGRLFQSFQQGSRSTSRKYGGTGLGLAISKRLTELMQGEIGVDSSPDNGATFWFTVRLGYRSENIEDALETNTDLSHTPTLHLDNARVLLVEDNEINQEVACELLRELNIEAVIAENGAIALKMLQKFPFDIVLMDMQMPVMDGITATQLIREMPQFATLPIIAMTANALASDREDCLSAGMNDHIAKPIDPPELAQKLLHWVAKRLP